MMVMIDRFMLIPGLLPGSCRNLRKGALLLTAACLLGVSPATTAQRAPAARPPAVVSAFTPGQALPLVLDAIAGARTSIQVAAYSFTSRPIATALRDAARRGIEVRVVIDAQEASKGYSAARSLANSGVAVRANARYAIQQNKFMVIDASVVQTGSFNYTSSAAERNAENVVVIKDAPELARAFAAEWRRLWDEGAALPPAY
jgi:phosphatidylserine/phosphatidylglycerophosphate/cardiolipin synthase-like enzyme